MTDIPVSVIVVSRDRSDALCRCLAGIEQLDYPEFEVIVVSDPGGLAALDRAGVTPRIKRVGFDEANISAARNHGLAVAAGQVVAFIDDDAVPEPTWLSYLVAPFAAGDIAAAGGNVRGRNGISFQSTGQSVDSLGRQSALPINGEEMAVFTCDPGLAVKTEGTNCAFRRDVLLQLGGFDPAFHFYMEETDLNLRLAAARLQTAVVPLAQVHHGFAASAQRHASRLPRTLFDVGASTAVFLRKHAPPDQVAPALSNVRAEQRARILRHMVAGTCEPRDVARLMATLDDGFAAGQIRDVAPLFPLSLTPNRFKRFIPANPFTGSDILAGRTWSGNSLRAEAVRRIAAGKRVSLFLFSPTAIFHSVRFDPLGYWEQRGGLFGKSLRSDPLFRRYAFKSRLYREATRVQPLRAFPELPGKP